jgi:hypothetical protein
MALERQGLWSVVLPGCEGYLWIISAPGFSSVGREDNEEIMPSVLLRLVRSSEYNNI